MDKQHEPTARYLQALEWLKSADKELEKPVLFDDEDLSRRREVLTNNVRREIHRLDLMGDVAWSRLKVERGLLNEAGTEHGGPPIIGARTSHSFLSVVLRAYSLPGSRFNNMEPLLLSSLLLVVIMHGLAASSQPHIRFLLASLRVIIYAAFIFVNGNSRAELTPEQLHLLANFPQDVRSIIRRLELEPDHTLYACCGECFSLYPPNDQTPRYPETCGYRGVSGKVCGNRLVYEATRDPDPKKPEVLHALKVYPYQNIFSWIRDLFLRPGLEELMASAWTTRSRSGEWNDIWDAPTVHNFLGPDRVSPFSVQPNHSVHLLFSLFVDWFNPFGNKTGGKSHSIGAIYMACLNLPADIRYRPENIYLVGIIPGPREPSLEQINHFLRPLVDDLRVLWSTGIYLSQTAARSVGRLVRAAVILLVCDLPALRKVAGFAGHRHNKFFCSFCNLPRTDINNTNPDSWPKGFSWSEHLEAAKMWKDAPTEASRVAIFERFGKRWSELLRLEYWDPTKFTVVDAMHNLFLGDIRHHCMEVWGIKVTGGENTLTPHSPEKQQQELDKIAKAVKKNSLNMLKAVRKGYIVAVVRVNDIVPDGTAFRKIDYIHGLLAWVRSFFLQEFLRLTSTPKSKQNDPSSLVLPAVLPEATAEFRLASDVPDISKTSILTGEILDAVRNDIQAIHVPSWIERPPSNFGSASHGKLKADTWRTLFTVHLTITLVRTWGSRSASDREKTLLQNFVHLAVAADLASRRSMSSSRAEAYGRHILAYLRTLRTTFDHPFVPNHHLSYHLKECLLRFGPVHSWWTYPFERYNGIIARLNSNNKAGKSTTFTPPDRLTH